ncbi:MAG: multidrug transporter [Gammaproteobacteria bacterium]|nr:multidrug transporter [Gammaproteobacteria bacterium]
MLTTEQSSVKNKFIIVFILTMIFVSQSTIDIYLPSFPTMQHYFHVPAAYIQSSLTAYLISYAFSQLLYGPLSDQYGRKTILFIGILIFISGSILCATAQTIWILLLGRCIQGAGIGAANALSRIVLRDTYSGAQLLKNASYLTMTWALSPLIAPVIGAYLQGWFGWRSNFIYLALFGCLFLIAMLLFLPETLAVSARKKINITNLQSIYLSLLKNKQFIKSCFGAALLFSAMITVSSLSPFIYSEIFHFSAVQYGWTTFTFCSGFLLGSINAPKISKKIAIESLATYAFISILALFIINMLVINNLYVFTSILFAVMFLAGVISPQCVANSMATVSVNIGFAGALFGFIAFTVGFTTTFLVSRIGTPSIILLISCLAGQFLLLFFWLRKSKLEVKKERFLTIETEE